MGQGRAEWDRQSRIGGVRTGHWTGWGGTRAGQGRTGQGRTGCGEVPQGSSGRSRPQLDGAVWTLQQLSRESHSCSHPPRPLIPAGVDSGSVGGVGRALTLAGASGDRRAPGPGTRGR